MTSDSYSDYYEASLDETLKFDDRLSPLSDLILSIDRPGDYCVHGSRTVPMPRIEAGRTGTLAFPLQPSQARILVSLAERAPYGKGEETIVDRNVRDCWQIAPEALSIGGATWDATFSGILDDVSTGLGCPREALTAELYKLLVYEQGGFFAPHRDTEKANGMVATLVIALPASGEGGELAVRHHGRETVVEMLSDDPSELTFAAFYADCEHEIRPVTKGHRICLVYNLMLTPGQEAPAKAPDFTSTVYPIADAIKAYFDDPDSSDKLIWVLEHDYSTAGLSFDALKNVDAAVGRVLAAAAERSDCVLYLAGLHIEESGGAEYVGNGYESYDDFEEADDYDMYEVFDLYCRLDNFIASGGAEAEFSGLPLGKGELMPPDRLEPDAPDSQRLTEATGNAGATLERHYFRAAFALWPRAATPSVVARAGYGALAAFMEAEWKRCESGLTSRECVEAYASQAVDSWPKPPSYHADEWGTASARMLKVLCGIGSLQATKRILDQAVFLNYRREMNQALLSAAAKFGADEMGGFLHRLADTYASRMQDEIVELAGFLRDGLDCGPGSEWHDRLKETVLAICSGFESACSVDLGRIPKSGEWSHRRLPPPWSVKTLSALFDLAWQFGLEEAASKVARAFCGSPKRATPDRAVPQLLEKLAADHPETAAGSGAFHELWRHASIFLLSRSRTRPGPPSDWVISSRGLSCKCEYCRDVVRFCADPVATELRIPVRQDIRLHISSNLDRSGIDIKHRTEKKGSPHSLICTKTRGTYDSRMKQYRGDVTEFRRLLSVAEKVPNSSETVKGLRMAVAAANGE